MEKLGDDELLAFAMLAMNTATAPARKASTDQGTVVLKTREWSPFTNYSDALELANKVGIDVRQPPYLPDAEDLVPGPLPVRDTDSCARACRAIVEAAAEKGKALTSTMGSVTGDLLLALAEAQLLGEVIVRITLYASAWRDLFKEGSGRIGQVDGVRTFEGIPVVPNERDPISPRFVLETK